MRLANERYICSRWWEARGCRDFLEGRCRSRHPEWGASPFSEGSYINLVEENFCRKFLRGSCVRDRTCRRSRDKLADTRRRLRDRDRDWEWVRNSYRGILPNQVTGAARHEAVHDGRQTQHEDSHEHIPLTEPPAPRPAPAPAPIPASPPSAPAPFLDQNVDSAPQHFSTTNIPVKAMPRPSPIPAPTEQTGIFMRPAPVAFKAAPASLHTPATSTTDASELARTSKGTKMSKAPPPLPPRLPAVDENTAMELGAAGSTWDDTASDICNRAGTIAADAASNADSEVISDLTSKRWHPSDDWANEMLESALLDMRNMPSQELRQAHYDHLRKIFLPKVRMPQHMYECFFLIYERLPQLLSNTGHWTMPPVADKVDADYIAPPSFLADRYVNYQGLVCRYDRQR